MNIKISNIDALTQAFDAAQHGCRQRTIGIDDILSTLQQVEDHLRIPKGKLDGVRMDANPCAQTFPRAYRYTPMSTQFSAVYKNRCWHITDIYRGKCGGPRSAVRIELTDAAREAVLEHASFIQY